MTKPANYYVAVLSSHRPDLHITLSYHRKLSEDDVADLEESVDDFVKKYQPHSFDIDWSWAGWFGYTNNIRVLQPRPEEQELIPFWVPALVSQTRNNQSYEWAPHITCDEDRLELRMDRIAIMCKSEEITNWPLEKDPK